MIPEHRSCQCIDRPCCGCDNGTFEIEEFPYPGDSTIEPDEEFDSHDEDVETFPNEPEDSWLEAAYEDQTDLGDW